MATRKLNFNTVIARYQALRQGLPLRSARDAKIFFEKSWRNQGFTDKTLIKWRERKRTRSRRDSGRAILVDTGTLRRDLVASATPSEAKVSTTTRSGDYAAVHNEGTAKIPQRQFMGHSEKLMDKLEEDLFDAIDKIWMNA